MTRFRLPLLFVLIFSSNAWAIPKNVASPQDIAPNISQLTKEGNNRQPLIFGNKGFFYISRDRSAHKDSQIYFRDFQTGKDKRITHQRGHIIGGIWLDEGQLVYASSTDEDKETPLALKPYLERFPSQIDTQFFFHLDLKPTEIYSSDMKGLDIKRLSNHQGLDAFPAFLKSRNRLYFSRFEDNQIRIYSRKMGSKTPPKMELQTLGHDLGLQLSPGKDQFVWYRFSPDFKSSQLMISGIQFKNERLLTDTDGIKWSPSWHHSDNTILYSAKKNQDRNYNIYEISPDSNCHRKLTNLEGDEFYPVTNSQGTKLLFTATKTGNEQIHEMDFPTPPWTCPPNPSTRKTASAQEKETETPSSTETKPLVGPSPITIGVGNHPPTGW